ncbi:putative ABC transporter permease [Fulvivirga imtechensis AK7]|uniref:Putative ABC transporter permease n=1 Tax=Fulvivirga imtechensis AK7 TaxID=1237149 RepID=L8JN80_9BACT|nr:FtsX-like permease family protein [Fulvivirga imtechensis]ELR70265.1 putative ABC transporter permease [Fulvivirga imtechensis AK7]
MNNNKYIPPRLAERLLLWFLRNDLAEEVSGDLEERFYKTAAKKSLSKAKLNYWYQVFHYLRPFAIKKYRSNSNPFIMYQHNFKLTYRNFIKYKTSFFINLIGLTTGLSSALLIFLWVSDELAMDKLHEKDEQLYQVFLTHEENSSLRTGPETQGLLAEALLAEVPEVVMAAADTETEWFGDNFAVSNGEEVIKAKGKFSGEDYFNLFSYKFKHGIPDRALSDKSSIVITESLALKLFNTTQVVGKTVEWHLLHLQGEASISAVLEDLPSNSSEQFNFVLPFSIYKDIIGDGMHWGNFNAYTYVELAKDININALNHKIASFVKDRDEGSNVSPFFKQFSSNYLYGTFNNGIQTGGRITYVRLFSVIAIFILVIACINFMNLSTARASRRLKEIGIKKTLGAGRVSLIFQHMGEAVLITFFALFLASLLTFMILPEFNELTGKQLSLQFTPEIIGAAILIGLFTGLLAGSYPALYLSGFKPVSILKGKLNASFGEVWIRKGLVVFQFALSVIMIVGVLVVFQQIRFIQTKSLGYSKDNILKIPVEGKAVDNMATFFDELKNLPGVLNATATTHSMVESGAYTTGIHWEGKDPDVPIRFEQARVYYDFVETLGIKVLEGRSFSKKFGNEQSKIIFNESAIEAMDMQDPVGKKIIMWGKEKEIIGVVKDFHYASLHTPVEPMLFYFEQQPPHSALVKIDGENIQEAIANIQSFYKTFNPGYMLDYKFLDQNYQAQYIAEQRVSVLSQYFAGIAIVISCLGLFGLAAFTAERRQKEIGIRKILGAGNFSIVTLLSGDFTKMVLVAVCLALPVSYFLAQYWLSGFAYKIDLHWWLFGLAGVAALVIAWLTVGFQTLKTANINPVQCLKDE